MSKNRVEYLSFFSENALFKGFKFHLYKVVKTSSGFENVFITKCFSNSLDIVKAFILNQGYKDIILISYYGLKTYYVPKYKKFFNDLSERELSFIFQRCN